MQCPCAKLKRLNTLSSGFEWQYFSPRILKHDDHIKITIKQHFHLHKVRLRKMKHQIDFSYVYLQTTSEEYTTQDLPVPGREGEEPSNILKTELGF